jgi:hypothetical protein
MDIAPTSFGALYRIIHMEPLEKLQALSIAVKTLAEIENLSIHKSVKEQLTEKVLGVFDIEMPLNEPNYGSIDKIVAALTKLGGRGDRSAIVAETGLHPNAVSSLLNKLVKSKDVEKRPIENDGNNENRTGRGLQSKFTYVLIKEALDDEDVDVD